MRVRVLLACNNGLEREGARDKDEYNTMLLRKKAKTVSD